MRHCSTGTPQHSRAATALWLLTGVAHAQAAPPSAPNCGDPIDLQSAAGRSQWGGCPTCGFLRAVQSADRARHGASDARLSRSTAATIGAGFPVLLKPADRRGAAEREEPVARRHSFADWRGKSSVLSRRAAPKSQAMRPVKRCCSMSCAPQRRGAASRKLESNTLIVVVAPRGEASYSGRYGQVEYGIGASIFTANRSQPGRRSLTNAAGALTETVDALPSRELREAGVSANLASPLFGGHFAATGEISAHQFHSGNALSFFECARRAQPGASQETSRKRCMGSSWG